LITSFTYTTTYLLTPQRNVSHFVRKSQSLPSSTAVGLLAHSLSTDEPALTSALDDIVSGPSPDPAYRAALRRGIDGAGALRVLSLLVEWAEAGSAVSDGLDVWPERAPRTATPALASVIAHASALLDAHLPSLIPMPDAEPLLLRLQEALAPALAAQADYRRLRAPVDAALRLAKPEKKEATAAAATQHGRKSAARVESKTPGLTEEAVGKYRVEDIVF
jgi:hypothetical protein